LVRLPENPGRKIAFEKTKIFINIKDNQKSISETGFKLIDLITNPVIMTEVKRKYYNLFPYKTGFRSNFKEYNRELISVIGSVNLLQIVRNNRNAIKL
jgi:hypothetical protein